MANHQAIDVVPVQADPVPSLAGTLAVLDPTPEPEFGINNTLLTLAAAHAFAKAIDEDKMHVLVRATKAGRVYVVHRMPIYEEVRREMMAEHQIDDDLVPKWAKCDW